MRSSIKDLFDAQLVEWLPGGFPGRLSACTPPLVFCLHKAAFLSMFVTADSAPRGRCRPRDLLRGILNVVLSLSLPSFAILPLPPSPSFFSCSLSALSHLLTDTDTLRKRSTNDSQRPGPVRSHMNRKKRERRVHRLLLRQIQMNSDERGSVTSVESSDSGDRAHNQPQTKGWKSVAGSCAHQSDLHRNLVLVRVTSCSVLNPCVKNFRISFIGTLVLREPLTPSLLMRMPVTMTMTHSEKSDIRQMKAWPYRQECRVMTPQKKNLLCW